MCNPRRVRVRASRQLAQAWSHQVRRSVTRSGAVVGEARMREPLGATVGGPALAALESVLLDIEGWEQDEEDGTFRYQLDGGLVVYYPDTHELEISASASAQVEVSGDAETTVGGELTGDVSAEGVGVYYDDGWGGITRADAERAAEADAERALDEAARTQEAQEAQLAEQRVGDAVTAEATAAADAALETATAARVEELRAEATRRLTAIGVQGRNVFNQALAHAYRNAILAYARSRGVEEIRETNRGGVVDIEFEMQVGS